MSQAIITAMRGAVRALRHTSPLLLITKIRDSLNCGRWLSGNTSQMICCLDLASRGWILGLLARFGTLRLVGTTDCQQQLICRQRELSGVLAERLLLNLPILHTWQWFRSKSEKVAILMGLQGPSDSHVTVVFLTNCWSVPDSLRLPSTCFKHVSLVDPISGLMHP